MVTSTYIPLATLTLTSTDSEVVFSSIPATYRDLVLVIAGSGLVSGFVLQLMHLNNDLVNSNYSSVRMAGEGSTTLSDTAASPRIGNIYVDEHNNTIVQIMDYSATDKHTTWLARQNMPNQILMAEAGRWGNTAAVNQVRITASGQSYKIGTTFSLYGVN